MGISRPKTAYIKAFATIFLRNSNGFYYNLLSILFPLCKKISREMFASFLYDTLFFGKNQLSEIFFREHYIGVTAHYAEEAIYRYGKAKSRSWQKSGSKKKKTGIFQSKIIRKVTLDKLRK